MIHNQREIELEAVRNMGYNGDDLHVNTFQDGGAHVFRTIWGYIIYEIPLYGGQGVFVDHVTTPEEVIRIAYDVLI